MGNEVMLKGDAISVGWKFSDRLPMPNSQPKERRKSAPNKQSVSDLKEPNVNAKMGSATQAQKNEARLYESFRRMGMTEEQAAVASAGRDGSVAITAARAQGNGASLSDAQRRMAESFRQIGLSESAAVIAAKGRD